MYEWTEMSFYKFPSFQDSFSRDKYESYTYDDEEIEEAEEDEECWD